MRLAKIILTSGPTDKTDSSAIVEQIKQATKKSKADLSFELLVSDENRASEINSIPAEGIPFSAVTKFSGDNGSEFVVLMPVSHIKIFGNILNLLQNGKKNFSGPSLYASTSESTGKLSTLFRRIFTPFNTKGKLSGIFVMQNSVAEILLPSINIRRVENASEIAYKAVYNGFTVKGFSLQAKQGGEKNSRNIFINSLKSKTDWFLSAPVRDLKQNGFDFKQVIANGNHSIYRLLFFALCVIVFFALPWFSFDFGITMDEPEDNNYFKKVLQYFLTFGEDKSCLDTTYRVNSHLINYGPFVNLLCVIAEKYFSPFGEYETRHIIISLFGVLGIIYTGLVAKKFGNWSMAVVSVIFLVLTPVWFGHSMNNQKDLPFASLYIVSVFFILKFVNELPRPTLRTWVLMTLTFGITMSIRIGGLLVLAYTGLFTFLFVLWQMKKTGFGKNYKTGFSLLLKLILVTIIGYILGILFWPYALDAPIENPMKALKSFENFSLVHIWEIFEGKRYYMKDFPWYYIPKSILITVPLFVIAGFFLAIPFIPVLYKKFNKTALGILFFVAIFPVAYIIIKDAVVYSSWRHVLFIYPPVVILSAAGWQGISSLFKNSFIKLALIVIASFLVIRVAFWMVKNHPYEYVYYNEIVGGVAGAYGNYETDYWCQSPRAGVEWLAKNGHFVPHKKIIVASNNVSASLDNYVPEDTGDSVQILWTRECEWGKNFWDYGVFTTRTLTPAQLKNGSFPPPGTIHTIDVDGIPLAAVVKMENSSLAEGNKFIVAGKFAKADSVLQNAVIYSPKNEEAWRTLGLAQLNKGDLVNAEKSIRKSIELMPENSYAYTFLGFIYMRKHDPANATLAYNEALKYRVNNNLAYESLGDLSANAKDYSAAQKYYETAFQYNGNQETLYDKMGRINFTRYTQNTKTGSKFLEDALRYFNAALTKNPKNPNNYYNVAIVLDKQGRKEESKRYFDEYKRMTGK